MTTKNKDLTRPRAHHTKKQKQLGIIPQDGFMRLDQVLSVLPISKTSLYSGIKNGIYPAPKKLGSRSSAWLCEDIRALIAKLGGES